MDKEMTNKEKEAMFKNPQQGETRTYPEGLEEEATEIVTEAFKETLEETLEEMNSESPDPKTTDQQGATEDDAKQELPTGGIPLSEGEQLAHTQTAYQGLLEDFNKVSRELTDLKAAYTDVVDKYNGTANKYTDLVDEKLTLLEAVKLKGGEVKRLEEVVKLKQQVIDDIKPPYEETAAPAEPADAKELQKQVADLEEANRILRRRLQS